MFIPLTIAILRGVLSPISLAEKELSPWKLQQAIRRLQLLPDSAVEVASLLRQLFEEWQVPVRLPDSFLPRFPGHLQRLCDTYSLLRLRTDEMGYAFHLSYSSSPATTQGHFYEALLHAEARWLKLLLREEIARMRSDADARLLLCEVLEEVYAAGADADEAARCGFMPEVCLQLKGALASLYLKLTLEFGCLLRPTDYLDYRLLLSDARYLHPIDEHEAWEYAVYQMENEARNLVVSDDAFLRGEDAMSLYHRMENLHKGMGKLTASSSLCRGMILMENFLFIRCCDLLSEEERDIRVLFDPDRLARWTAELRDGRYSSHLDCREGRAACYYLFKRRDANCFTFLSCEVDGGGSVPRILRAYLCCQEALYEQNYARMFTPVKAGDPLVTVPVIATVPSLAEDIHTLLNFMDYVPVSDKDGQSPTPARQLEKAFYDFLSHGKVGKEYFGSVRIRQGWREVVYGAIFHYREVRGGRPNDYAYFLCMVIADIDIQVGTLLSNVKRYVKAYLNYVSKIGKRQCILT